MSFTPPVPSQEILSLVQSCGSIVNASHTQEIAKAFEPPREPAEAAEPTGEQLEAVYETARKLCDEENFQFAAALSLHLFSYKPVDPRFGFLAGTCMQRLGMNGSAVKFFCFALVSGGDHPAALFRLGECLLALGDRVNAEKAFDAALDVSRHDADAHEIQTQANELVHQLSAGAPDRRGGA
jgi:tetratricopeptide (TPR) repeat protein